MKNKRLVWSDDKGDQRKVKPSTQQKVGSTHKIELHVRRLTSGKGRTVIQISELPSDKDWCKDLAKQLKKSLGVGGTYKQGAIEIHGEKIDLVTQFFDKKSIRWKKTGG